MLPRIPSQLLKIAIKDSRKLDRSIYIPELWYLSRQWRDLRGAR